MKTRKLTVTALFAAMVCVATMFIHIPVPMTGGYAHIGDAFIYLAACMLPMPYAMAAGAIGAGMADALGGYYVYVIPTLIIKALLVIPFSSADDKIVSLRNIVSSVAARIIYGSTVTALANLISGMVQPAVSMFIFVLFGLALDKSGVKKRFKL